MKSKSLVSEKTIMRMQQAAGELWQRGEYAEYFRAMDRVSMMDPRNARVALDVGTARLMRYEYSEAEENFERAIFNATDKAGISEMVALQCRNLNRYDWAEKYLERAAAQPNVSADSLTKLAEMYERLRRIDQSNEMVDRALAMSAGNPLALLVKARLSRLAGRLEEAETTVRSFLNRTDADSWSTRIRGWYELGANLDRQGRFDEAMAAFLSAKALIRPMAGPAVAQQKEVHVRLKHAAEDISADVLKRWRDEGESQDKSQQRMAIICGHPRSGTTLLEQLLDSHPMVISAEEMPIFYDGYLALRKKVPDSAEMRQTLESSPAMLRQVREWYLRSMENFFGERIGNRLLIDKNPSLTGLIPAIVRLFPQAKLIVALRDPRDVCLSCFMQPLPLNPTSAMYLTMETTAEEYASLMQFYRDLKDRLPIGAMEVRYEDVVKNAEGISREVLSFLGLEWDARVLRFDQHAKQKLVRSPTYAEVARPITNVAVGRWKNYQKYLEPCLEKLQPFAAGFGYAD